MKAKKKCLITGAACYPGSIFWGVVQHPGLGNIQVTAHVQVGDNPHGPVSRKALEEVIKQIDEFIDPNDPEDMKAHETRMKKDIKPELPVTKE